MMSYSEWCKDPATRKYWKVSFIIILVYIVYMVGCWLYIVKPTNKLMKEAEMELKSSKKEETDPEDQE